MECRNVLKDFLKDNSYDLEEDKSKGIEVNNDNGQLVIKGSRLDLIELADYITSVALSENGHIHLDNLTIIKDDSKIKEIIIEKE